MKGMEGGAAEAPPQKTLPPHRKVGPFPRASGLWHPSEGSRLRQQRKTQTQSESHRAWLHCPVSRKVGSRVPRHRRSGEGATPHSQPTEAELQVKQVRARLQMAQISRRGLHCRDPREGCLRQPDHRPPTNTHTGRF